MTPDLPTSTNALGVALYRDAGTLLGDPGRADEAMAYAEAAQLVLRAADILHRAQARRDPAAASERNRELAAFLERERPDLFEEVTP